MQSIRAQLKTRREEETANEELCAANSRAYRAHITICRTWIAATDVGTLFLDNKLNIKRFTPHVANFFSITENNEGRPITDFTHRLKYSNLTGDARSVLADLVPIEREVESDDGKWFIVRFRPYRTMDDKIEGL